MVLSLNFVTAVEGHLVVNHGKLPPFRRDGSKCNPASLSPAAPGWDIIEYSV